MRKVIALLFMVFALWYYMRTSSNEIMDKVILDPLGIVNRDALGELAKTCQAIVKESGVVVRITLDTVTAETPISQSAEPFFDDMKNRYADSEWIALYLLQNGESLCCMSEEMQKRAEEKNILNLDLLVMKQVELSDIEAGLKMFIVNLADLTGVTFSQVSDESSKSKSFWDDILPLLISALIFAIGLALLIFDVLLSRKKVVESTIPNPLFGGDFILYDSTLFGSGLGKRKE